MRMRAPLALAAAAALTVSLAGCFANPLDRLAESGVEDVIEQVTGGEVDIDAGGGATVPEGFPAEIPLPSGSPNYALRAGDSWQLEFRLADAAEAEPIVAWFPANGYTESGVTDMGEMKIWIFEGDAYQANLSLITADEQASLVYIVTAR